MRMDNVSYGSIQKRTLRKNKTTRKKLKMGK
jgi:hypothetical protein